MITTLLVREPQPRVAPVGEHQEQRVRDWLASRAHWPPFAQTAGAGFVGAVVCPLTDFLGRFSVRIAALLLLLIGSYRLTDFTMGVMANPFYIDHGYSLGQIATVVKFVGLALSMIGVVLVGRGDRALRHRARPGSGQLHDHAVESRRSRGWPPPTGRRSWVWVLPMDWTTWRWRCTARR